MKYKMNNGEKKTDFATRLITEHGEFLSASEAYELIDKRTASSTSSAGSFQANLSDAVRKGNLAKKKGEDSAGRSRVLYGPKGLELLYDPMNSAYESGKLPLNRWQGIDPFAKKLNSFKLPNNFTKRLTDADKKNKPTFEDIPLGSLLEFNGTTKDDIMSVIEDWLFDTPLYQLRQKYPALETILKELV